jgi:hypothetical protein
MFVQVKPSAHWASSSHWMGLQRKGSQKTHRPSSHSRPRLQSVSSWHWTGLHTPVAGLQTLPAGQS